MRVNNEQISAAGCIPAGPGGTNDRRDGVRHDARKLGTLTARLIGGSEVSLVNFSNRGVLFECDSRLLIGVRASVSPRLTRRVMVTGKVVRSRVKGLVNGALRHDAALALDEDLMLAVPAAPEVAAPGHTLEENPSTPAWRAEDGMVEEAQAEAAVAVGPFSP